LVVITAVGSGKVAVLVAPLVAAAATVSPSVGSNAADSCAATTVQYSATRYGVPWLSAGQAFTGHLSYYPTILGDRRVNQSDGAVVYAGVASKVLWVPRDRRKARDAIVFSARELSGGGSFTHRIRSVSGTRFPSLVRLPRVGCWEVTLRSGRLLSRVVIQAIDAPLGSQCDPSPVYRRSPPHPKFGAITWMPATPRRSGVAAILFVSTVPGTEDAVIYSGGRAPEGWNTKFLWWAPRPGGSVKLAGRRIDGVGRFDQVFGPATADEGTVFPSIVDVPQPGCWAVTVQTGRSAGVVVFKAVASG
jgi:hypothetical protein